MLSCRGLLSSAPVLAVVLNFGVSHDWERTPQDMEIELAHRIVLSPFAAKRLSSLLHELIGEYESRYGELK